MGNSYLKAISEEKVDIWFYIRFLVDGYAPLKEILMRKAIQMSNLNYVKNSTHLAMLLHTSVKLPGILRCLSSLNISHSCLCNPAGVDQALTCIQGDPFIFMRSKKITYLLFDSSSMSALEIVSFQLPVL